MTAASERSKELAIEDAGLNNLDFTLEGKQATIKSEVHPRICKF